MHFLPFSGHFCQFLVIFCHFYSFWCIFILHCGGVFGHFSDIFVIAPLGTFEPPAPKPPAKFGTRPTKAGRQRPHERLLSFFELNRHMGDPPPLRGLSDTEIWSTFVETWDPLPYVQGQVFDSLRKIPSNLRATWGTPSPTRGGPPPLRVGDPLPYA